MNTTNPNILRKLGLHDTRKPKKTISLRNKGKYLMANIEYNKASIFITADIYVGVHTHSRSDKFASKSELTDAAFAYLLSKALHAQVESQSGAADVGLLLQGIGPKQVPQIKPASCTCGCKCQEQKGGAKE